MPVLHGRRSFISAVASLAGVAAAQSASAQGVSPTANRLQGNSNSLISTLRSASQVRRFR
jgi:hypothetical protein